MAKCKDREESTHPIVARSFRITLEQRVRFYGRSKFRPEVYEPILIEEHKLQLSVLSLRESLTKLDVLTYLDLRSIL